MWPNPQFPANLVTFTEAVLNGNLRFLVQCTMTMSGIYEPAAVVIF